MKLSQADAEQEGMPQRPPRFTYPSGSRPLEGYTIKRGVGRGGFGEVYFAVSDAGKEVALKLIRRNLDVELRGVTQCLNLKHSNLIALYDIRSDDQDDRWVVMEYVSGESLEDAVDRHPQGMPPELALSWFRGICAGVAYLHDHGIVHRDLKPANIFLDDGTVKIGDYGLSKFISCSRRSGQTESVGTVHYMAPEIANGRYGREIDTYALGVILYEIVTGHVPFEGESVGEVLMKHLTAEPKLDGIQEPYRQIVAGALTKDPDMRIKSVGEMLELLPGDPNVIPRVSDVKLEDKPHVSEAAYVEPQNDSPAPPQSASYSDEEPILASLKAGWQHIEDKFRTSHWNPLAKALAAVGLLFFMVLSSPLWIETLAILLVVYLFYRVLRGVFLFGKTARMEAKNKAVNERQKNRQSADALKPTQMYRRKRRHSVRQRLEAYVAGKSTQERLTEMLGSMLVATLVAGMGSLVVLLPYNGDSAQELSLWTALVAIASCWAAIIPVRLMEGRVEDRAPIRFAQVVLGGLVGVFAWALSQALVLEIPISPNLTVYPRDTLFSGVFQDGLRQLSGSFNAGVATPQVGVFAAFFAFLFLIAGFGRGADTIRSSRVSLLWVGWCSLLGFLLHLFWWFPQPLGLLLAGVTAFSVQFASPWLPPSKRRAIAEEAA